MYVPSKKAPVAKPDVGRAVRCLQVLPVKQSASSSSSSTSEEVKRPRESCSSEREYPPGKQDEDESSESQKRQRILNNAFAFGADKDNYGTGESCERTVRQAVHSFHDVLGRDTGTKALVDTDAKLLLMRFPGLCGPSAEDAEEALFHPLVSKLSASRSAGDREIAGALATIMVQLELSRVRTP